MKIFKKVILLILGVILVIKINAQDVVAPRYGHGMCVSVNGTIQTWGGNLYGELGLNTIGGFVSSPVTVPGISNVVAIVSSNNHSLALKSNGTVWSWGSNASGKLGNGTFVENSKIPVRVINLCGIIKIAAGSDYSLALHKDGTVWGWGYNREGVLGSNSPSQAEIHTPYQIPNLVNVKEISAGFDFAMALLNDGTVKIWGNGNSGQLGNGVFGPGTHIPTTIPNLNNVVSISAGGTFGTCVLSDGTVRLWGYNQFGQLGNSTTTHSNTPINIGLSGVEKLFAGQNFVIAKMANNEYYGWGNNDFRQLLICDQSEMVLSPTQISIPSNVIDIIAHSGEEHLIGITSSGSAYSWGPNSYGQLGIGSTSDFVCPIANIQLVNPIKSNSIPLIPPTVTINNGASQVVICQGQSVNLSAMVNVIGGAFSWSNGSTNNIISVSPSTTTTYTVNYLIPIEGCNSGNAFNSASAQITVIVNPNSDPNFTFFKYDNCEGSVVNFVNVSNDAAQRYHWDFGDGYTSVTNGKVNVNHIYSTPGYYEVSLYSEIDNSNCDNKISRKLIHIIPSNDEYNPNCCFRDYTSYTDIEININSPKSNPAIWSTNKIIKGEVRILKNSALIIQPNITICFGPQGKIIVEDGAELTLNGCVLTSILFANCNSTEKRMMWQGIEVWGDGTALNSNQGKVTVNQNTLIEDAYIGIKLGKPSFEKFESTPNCFISNSFDVTKLGGILLVDGAIFNRNLNAIIMGPSKATSLCKIQNSVFKSQDPLNISTNKILDPDLRNRHLDDNSAYYCHNPHLYVGILPRDNWEYGGFFAIKSMSRSLINVSKNSFSSWGECVSMTNSKGLILENSFSNSDFSFTARNTNKSNISKLIKSNTFSSPIHINSNNFVNVTNNTFVGSSIYNDFLNVESLSIFDNIFENAFVALSVKNTGGFFPSHIGYLNSGNLFNNCRLPLSIKGNNSKLKIKCNRFTNPTIYDNYVWYVTEDLASQGMPSTSLVNPKDLAGNRYLTSNRNHINYNNQNFVYNSHAESFTHIEKYQNSIFQNIVFDEVYFVNEENSCLPIQSYPTNEVEDIKNGLSSNRAAIEQLQNLADDLYNSVENGNSDWILDAISSSDNLNELTDILIEHSPLRSDVLVVLAHKAIELGFDVEELYKIFSFNLPTIDYNWYNDIQPALINKYGSERVEQFSKLQVSISEYPNLVSIYRQITNAENISKDLLGSLFEKISFDTTQLENADQEIMNILNSEEYFVSNIREDVEYRKMQIGMNLDLGNISEARSVLESSGSMLDDITYSFYDLLIKLKSENRELWQLTDQELNDMANVASLCPNTFESLNAKEIFQLYYGIHYEECNDEYNRVINTTISAREKNNEVVFLNFPNPVNNYTWFKYTIDESCMSGKIKIFDLYGKFVDEIHLNPKENNVFYSTHQLSTNGVYIYELYVDNIKKMTNKFVLIK